MAPTMKSSPKTPGSGEPRDGGSELLSNAFVDIVISNSSIGKPSDTNLAL